MHSKIVKTSQFYIKCNYLAFATQAVSKETAVGTQKWHVCNFDISAVLVR